MHDLVMVLSGALIGIGLAVLAISLDGSAKPVEQNDSSIHISGNIAGNQNIVGHGNAVTRRGPGNG